MNSLDWQKLREVVLYILNATGGLDHYRVFKVLYFADKEHLKRYGRRIVSDDFRAYPYGPVSSNLYDALRKKSNVDISDIIEPAGEDAPNIFLPKRLYNPDYLSKTDILCLDISIEENSRLSFNELKDKSHDSAWQDTALYSIITPLAIAKAAGASDSIIEYIREQEVVDHILS